MEENFECVMDKLGFLYSALEHTLMHGWTGRINRLSANRRTMRMNEGWMQKQTKSHPYQVTYYYSALQFSITLCFTLMYMICYSCLWVCIYVSACAESKADAIILSVKVTSNLFLIFSFLLYLLSDTQMARNKKKKRKEKLDRSVCAAENMFH